MYVYFQFHAIAKIDLFIAYNIIFSKKKILTGTAVSSFTARKITQHGKVFFYCILMWVYRILKMLRHQFLWQPGQIIFLLWRKRFTLHIGNLYSTSRNYTTAISTILGLTTTQSNCSVDRNLKMLSRLTERKGFIAVWRTPGSLRPIFER